MSLPGKCTLEAPQTPLPALSLKLSDELLQKMQGARVRLVVKNSEVLLKLAHPDGSELVLDAKVQLETGCARVYSKASHGPSYVLVGSVILRLSVFSLKRTKSASVALASPSLLALPRDTLIVSGVTGLPKKPSKLVARSALAQTHLLEVRLMHLMALGPNTAAGLCARCRVLLDEGTELVRRYGEVLTAQSASYLEDRYFDELHVPQGGPPRSTSGYADQDQEPLYILRDSCYRHLSVWLWKYLPQQRAAVVANMARAFDRLGLAADDPVRSMTVDPKVLLQNAKEEESQAEERRRREYEAAQKKKEEERLDDYAESMRRQKLEAKNKQAKPGTNLYQKITKTTKPPERKKPLSRSSSQSSHVHLGGPSTNHPSASAHASTTVYSGTQASAQAAASVGGLIELGIGVTRPTEVTPLRALAKKLSLTTKAIRHLPVPMSDEDRDAFGDEIFTSDQIAGLVSSEEGARKKRTILSLSLSLASSSYASKKKEASTPSSGQTSPEMETEKKRVITNVSASLAPVASRPSAAMLELAQRFREKYKEYESLYNYIQQNKGKRKRSGYTEYQDDVRRVIQLHNELTIWKKKLWAAEGSRTEKPQSRTHSRTPSASGAAPLPGSLKREGRFEERKPKRRMSSPPAKTKPVPARKKVVGSPRVGGSSSGALMKAKAPPKKTVSGLFK